MFKRLSFYNSISACALLILVTTSCVPVIAITPSPGFTTTKTSKTITSTLTLSPTKFPAASHTITLFPAWTPLPTLLDSQAEARMLEWLQGSPTCALPCWAGITPGVTTWQEAKQILGEVVDLEAVHENIRCDIGPCNLIFWRNRTSLDLHGSIVSQSNSPIYGISLEGHPTTPVIRPDRILTHYGEPDKVFLETACHPMEPNDAYFGLILGYSKYHFFIKYHMRGILSGDNITGYLIPGEYVYLSIKQIDGEWTEELIKNALHGDEEIPAWFFRSLEDATDITIDDLYEIFKDIDGSEYIVAHCRD